MIGLRIKVESPLNPLYCQLLRVIIVILFYEEDSYGPQTVIHKSVAVVILMTTKSLFLDNDLDGEALAAALGQGPACLKEAIPSLSKRLKLMGAIQVLKASLVSIDSIHTPTVMSSIIAWQITYRNDLS